MNKILITGGKGFLGTLLREELESEQNAEVWTLDTKGNGEKHFNVPVQEFDRFDEFDKIYHFAAITDVGRCKENKSAAWDVNVEGTRNIVKQLNPSHDLIYASTSHVYNDQVYSKKEESSREKPSDFYGLTKSVSEDLIREYSDDTDFDYNIFRIFTLFGEGQRKGFLVPDVIEKAKNSDKVDVRGGDSKLSLSYVDDVIEVMMRDVDVGTYNVCSGCYSVREVYEIIVSEIGSSDLGNGESSGKKYLCGDNSRISEYKEEWKDLEQFVNDIS